MRFCFLILLGCSSSTLVELDPDGGVAFDVPVLLDASTPDAREPDAGTDAGTDAGALPEPPELATSLWCETNEEAALEMVTRYVACSWSEFYIPVSTFYLWWETGLLGARNEQSLRDLPYGCDTWRCIRDASTCAEVYDCQGGADECVHGEARCQGEESQTCIRGRWSTETDCAALDDGFACESDEGRAWCQRGDCRVGSGWDLRVRCEDDALVACEGADELRVACEDVRPGSACASVAPEGEIPLDYCGTPSEGQVIYGNEPVRCEDGSALFESFHSGELRVDCEARGYRCMENMGCVR